MALYRGYLQKAGISFHSPFLHITAAFAKINTCTFSQSSKITCPAGWGRECRFACHLGSLKARPCRPSVKFSWWITGMLWFWNCTSSRNTSLPCMSAQTQTNRAPTGYRRRCCEKAVLGIGVRQVSGTKEVEKLSPQIGGKVIYFLYPGLQNEVQLKWMVPGDTQRSGSTV